MEPNPNILENHSSLILLETPEVRVNLKLYKLVLRFSSLGLKHTV